MTHRGISRRRGSLTPIILLMVLILGVMGFVLLDAFQDSVTRRQGRAAAEAVALEVLRSLHPPAYAAPARTAVGDPRLHLSHLRRLAEANGLGPMAFARLEAEAIIIGPTWVSVRVESPDPDVGAIQAVVEGRPAARIAGERPGAEWAGGCAPLGVPLAAVPFAEEALALTFVLGLESDQAHLVSLVDRPTNLADWIRVLGAPVEAGAVTVPEVAVGDRIEPAFPSPGLVVLLKERLEGRIVILPYVHDGRIRGFGRVLVDTVEPATGAIRLVLAPSAVVSSAKPARFGQAAGAGRAAPVSPFGLALRAHVKG